ncbi:EF-hand domain-containing protein [Rhizobium sp. P40RR-XXII]|uniref:EF-hand domain-containing protein n=1 Tax=Rhizobium sp. P40RR-XXII TaxID=2726739 RepID=UPI001457304B|nr:EF-hand domain-containing protein [Rhizobium sp. P40RR-XXII]NLS20382.1 EF-hand domain-containing protein [Rhizobium sp. P40RR-XXII]
MSMIRTPVAVLLASMVAIGGPCLALAQTNEADDHRPGYSSPTNPPSEMGSMMEADQDAMNGSPMMSKGFQCMMMPGTTGGMPTMAMAGNMMKFMFAIADTDGDGSLSFDEVTAVHKRIFNAMDANKDGKVTPEEMRAFWLQ